MSIIQDIRDKYAKVSIALIALSLVGFILMDRFAGKGAGSVSRSKSVGSVNGRAISATDFEQEIEMNVSSYERQGYPVDPAFRQNLVNSVWDQMIDRSLVEAEASKLGIEVGKKERGDVFFGENAPQDFKSAGTGENGVYDPALAKKNIEQYLKSTQTTPEQREQLKRYMEQLVFQRVREKYQGLFTSSANTPRWLAEKQISDNSQMAKVAVVKSLYNSDSLFRDTTIKISDKEIADYINAHKDAYKQEATREINFVVFSAQPTSSDSLTIKNELSVLKPEFDTTHEVALFLQRNGSDYQDVYAPPAQLSPIFKDSITRLSKNGVFGPYLEGGSYVMAKYIDSKVLPDSIKCRHVLVSTDVAQGGFPDSIALQKIDSIKRAIEGGASWADMVNKYNPASDGSRAQNGEMTFDAFSVQTGMNSGGFAKEFGQFILYDGKPGQKKVVKTSFGYHYIDIMSYIKPQTNYKIAYLGKTIIASQATVDSALQAANEFAGSIKDAKSFDDVFQKTLKPKGYNKAIGVNIKKMDGSITGIQGFSRQFVRDIYAASLGEVLKPAEVDNNWVVAVVTAINKEGTQSIASVRPSIETMLRHKKIGEQLKQKAGNITSLGPVSALLDKPVQTIDSLRMTSGNPQADMPYDPKAFGVIFNPSNKGKIFPQLVVGEYGVYGIQVENVSASSTGANVEDYRKQQAGQAAFIPLQVLKKSATINDKRTSGTNNY